MSNEVKKSAPSSVVKSHSHVRALKTAEREASEAFRLSNQEHPLMATLKKLCIERRFLQLTQKEDDSP